MSIRMSKLDDNDISLRYDLRQHVMKREVSAYLTDSVAAECINYGIILLGVLVDRMDYSSPIEAMYR